MPAIPRTLRTSWLNSKSSHRRSHHQKSRRAAKLFAGESPPGNLQSFTDPSRSDSEEDCLQEAIMAENTLHGMRVAIFATDGVEEAELKDPRGALDQAGAKTTLFAPKEGKIQAFKHMDKSDRLNIWISLIALTLTRLWQM